MFACCIIMSTTEINVSFFFKLNFFLRNGTLNFILLDKNLLFLYIILLGKYILYIEVINI